MLCAACAAITPAQTKVFKCHEYTAQFAQLKPKSSDVTRTLHSLRSHQASINKSLQVSREHCRVCAAACQHKHVFKCYKYTTQPAQPASQLKPKSSDVTSTLHILRSHQSSTDKSLQVSRVHCTVCAAACQHNISLQMLQVHYTACAASKPAQKNVTITLQS
jgi:tRNA(Arg) A34 adenosine deaminase TadA